MYALRKIKRSNLYRICYIHIVSRQEEEQQPQGQQDSPFFSEHSVHLRVIRDDDVVFHVGLWWRETELDEADLCLFDARYTPASGRLSVKENSLDHLRVVDGPAQLFEDFDVLEINVGGGGRILDDLKKYFMRKTLYKSYARGNPAQESIVNGQESKIIK